MDWLVLHTKPRHEKKVAEDLKKMGFEIFLPLQKVIRQWSDRKKKVQEPLFKSYIFIHIDEKTRHVPLMNYGVIRYLYWCGKPAVVRDAEIDAIREFIGEIDYLPEDKIEFIPGDDIKIKWGVFSGEKGKYIARQGDHLILLLESMGQMVKAEVPVRHVI